MIRFFTFLFLFSCFATNLFAQNIPKTAVILEKGNISKTRQLVLWMPNPKKNPRDVEDDIYTCPDQTRGHYYSGIAKVSLIDVQTKKTINTIEIITEDENSIDLPYLIKPGYYKIGKADKNKEGKPILLELKDYNNDGKVQEFALFDAIACMGLRTTLIGYSKKQDKVIQYQTELEIEKEKVKIYQVDYLFGQKPNKQGVYKYEIDYRGRGGSLDKYEIRYDKKREMFYGTLKRIFEDESKAIKEKERPHK